MVDAFEGGNFFDPVEFVLPAHATTHQNGGSDEIDVTGLSGLLGDAQTPLGHSSSHEDTGTDEIDVTGLSGLLADGQTPLAHAATHAGGSTDPITSLGAHAVTGTLTGQHIVPSVDATYDLGENSTPLHWRTLYLSNDGGNIIDVPGAIDVGAATDYTMMLGGGFYAPTLGGGTFTFEFESAVAGGENLLVFDLGAVYFSGGPTFSNDFAIQCYNGLDTHRFIAKFGGWTNPEYGWALDRITGTAENASKTLFFDNQEPVSDSLRSIDFRINSVNILTIENDQTVAFPLRKVTAPTGLIVNGFASITSQTVFNLYDIFTVSPVNTNAGGILSVKPAGSSTTSAMLTTNSVSTTDYGTLENSISGTMARFVTWRLATGTGPTTLAIGELPSAFFGVGICDSLTSMDFYFAGALAPAGTGREMQLQKDTLIFNNNNVGGTHTQIDWGTNGQLGLQVATNDIIRLTATQIQAIQDIVISDAQNIVVNTATGTKIGTATNQKLGFYNATPVIKATALTAALTQISHTGPGTPDYAIATPIDSSVGAAWGFSNQNEFETAMSVILNLQTRVDELETKLQTYGLLA